MIQQINENADDDDDERICCPLDFFGDRNDDDDDDDDDDDFDVDIILFRHVYSTNSINSSLFPLSFSVS